MEGQYTDEEFKEIVRKAGQFKTYMNWSTGTAMIKYGNNTYNYYRQHSDGSWTNYDCKTIT